MKPKIFKISLIILAMLPATQHSMDSVSESELMALSNYFWQDYLIKEEARKNPETLLDAARFGNVNGVIKHIWSNNDEERILAALRLSMSSPSYDAFRILFEKVKARNGRQATLKIVKNHLWSSCKYGSFWKDSCRILTFSIKECNPTISDINGCLEIAIKNYDYDRVRILLAYGAVVPSHIKWWFMGKPNDPNIKTMEKIIENHQKNSGKLTLKNLCLCYILQNRDFFRDADFRKIPPEALNYSS